ncbi:hypothetical protein [Rhodococcus sp. JVH1]|uniref:hypothetical protein n=1 Tax=Rhodococcus sp. JVH1 TaxID=745408 RepID=UPI000271F92C|nr:hypothetical protein [Rhodococcus sp. JVH1]EJI97911.1 hypothetical protein JVH1_4705 [Rhodococcus sp. JVH1]
MDNTTTTGSALAVSDAISASADTADRRWQMPTIQRPCLAPAETHGRQRRSPTAVAFGPGTLARCRELYEILLKTGTFTAEGRWMTDFAIRWSPYGGSSAAELLEHFGVTRQRYLDLLRIELGPTPADLPRIRDLKRELTIHLGRAWTESRR